MIFRLICRIIGHRDEQVGPPHPYRRYTREGCGLAIVVKMCGRCGRSQNHLVPVEMDR